MGTLRELDFVLTTAGYSLSGTGRVSVGLGRSGSRGAAMARQVVAALRVRLRECGAGFCLCRGSRRKRQLVRFSLRQSNLDSFSLRLFLVCCSSCSPRFMFLSCTHVRCWRKNALRKAVRAARWLQRAMVNSSCFWRWCLVSMKGVFPRSCTHVFAVPS